MSFYTSAEVAGILGVSRCTVAYWVRPGFLSATRDGRRYRFRANEVVRYLAQRGSPSLLQAGLTTDRAATVLGIRRETVSQYIRAGRLHAGHVGRAWVLSEEEISRYVASRGAAPNLPYLPQPRTCAQCGSEFPGRRTARYCSPACK